MISPLLFYVPENFNIHNFRMTLGEHFSLISGAETNKKRIFYDTFDWRLFKKRLMLYTDGRQITLASLQDESVLTGYKIPFSPAFARDIPAGKLREKLIPITEERALLKLFEARFRSMGIRILNEDQKTVAKLFVKEIDFSGENQEAGSLSLLQLKPLRGYDASFEELRQYLSKKGFVSAEDGFYSRLLEAAGKQPGEYSSKLNLRLDPLMHTDEAARSILKFLLSVIRRNEDGIRKDIDTEFLHDFRVAVRRTRSALSQIKGVFPEEVTRRFKRDFAYLGRKSNTLRDLDVYLLNAGQYRAMLPESMRDDINPLFDLLQKDRAVELKKVIRMLNSQKYKKILSDWETFLNLPSRESNSSPNAVRPVIELARERISKKYRRIVKTGKRIENDSADEKLHSLRIQCKKLRYLLEFFSSLFPKKKVNVLIKQLKKLQDYLGEFQDLCMQENTLQQFIEKLPATSPADRRTIAAIGSLISTIHSERERVRNSFSEFFEHFASAKNDKLFREVLSSPVEDSFSQYSGKETNLT